MLALHSPNFILKLYIVLFVQEIFSVKGTEDPNVQRLKKPSYFSHVSNPILC